MNVQALRVVPRVNGSMIMDLYEPPKTYKLQVVSVIFNQYIPVWVTVISINLNNKMKT